MDLISQIKIIAAVLAGLLVAGGLLCISHLKSDRDRLMVEAATYRQAAAEAIETLDRERAAWRATSQVLIATSAAQNDICQADMERRAQIDEIGRECTIVVVPEGSVDEQTSGKVVNMFNNSLFAPLGGRVRPEAN
jgi:hypothetical protein